MRELDPKFELFDSVRVGAGNWIVGDAAGPEIARLGETRGTAREFKNTGNKAKKLLKTKDITFLNAANQGSLAGQSAQIRPRSEQGQFGKARSGLTAARGGRAWTNCRLHGRQVDVALPLRPAGFCARSQLQRIQRPENGCGATAWFRTYCEFLDQPNKAVWARVRFSGRPRSRASAEFPMGGGIARPACPLRITVIGVAGDVREFGLAEAAIPEADYPETQETSSRIVLAVRTANDPQAQVPAIRHALHDLDILRHGQGRSSFPFTYGSLRPSRWRGWSLGVPQVMISSSAIFIGLKL